MPPSRPGGHQWTKFELQTMLSLIARGVHLPQRPDKRTDSADLTRNNAYEKFATRFNEAVHGKFNYQADLDKREIIWMLESLMINRKNVIGKNGLVERQRVGRITRTLRLAWQRSDGRSFDGSLAEWEGGRRDEVIRKDMVARGLVPKSDSDLLGDQGGVGVASDIASSLAFNKYTSGPSRAQAAHAGRNMPRLHQTASTTDLNTHDNNFHGQHESARPATISAPRAPSTRGKKSYLSSAYVNDDDEDNEVQVPVAPKRVLAPSTIAKKHDAVMNTLGSLAVQPSKIRESSQLGWMNPGGVMSPISFDYLRRDVEAAGSRVEGAGEVVKLKRPGRNASRIDTYSNKVTINLGPPSQEIEADEIQAKKTNLGNDHERVASTISINSETAPQVANFQRDASRFAVQDNLGPFNTCNPGNSYDEVEHSRTQRSGQQSRGDVEMAHTEEG